MRRGEPYIAPAHLPYPHMATQAQAASASGRTERRKIRQGGFFNQTLPFWLLLPTLLVLAAIQFYPGFYSIWLSLQERQGAVWNFVGLRNFQRIFDSAIFRESLGHTVVFLVGYVAVTMVASLIIALLLNRTLKLSGVYISLIFIPWVIADVIAGLVFGLLVVPDYGLLSPILSNPALFPPNGLSIPSDPAPRPWISGFPFPPAPAMYYLILATAWRALPFVTLLILAALKTVPQEIIESARIDGASSLQALRFITLPLILPTLVVALFNLTLGGMNGIGLVFTLTRGGPGTATEVLSFLLYTIGFDRLEFGRAAALSVFIAIINLVLIVLTLRVARTEERVH
ncbi:MAG: sugar ABC transporter permease [Thermoflexales bacterium]|nr:sugar ABC transporter permease [Thermoflexales bacterium]MDW8352817.1 sugar ABC transporter permease [Anaerolineae bacterium]